MPLIPVIGTQSAPAAGGGDPPIAWPQALLDLQRLHDISGGDPQTERDIFANFNRLNDVDALALHSGVLARDFPAVRATAHRMRGGALILGAERLGAACENIERAAHAGDDQALIAAVQVFEAEVLQLRAFIATHSPPAGGTQGFRT